MEALLQTTVAHSPNFDPALALGRIHSILTALMQHCRTTATYLYTGCYTCELHIRPCGNAFVPPVAPNIEAKEELLQMWELVREMGVPSGALISRSPHPAVSEPHRLQLTRTAGSSISPMNAIKQTESSAPLLYWTIVAPFAMYFALNICNDIFWKILPIATLTFQILFFLHFAVFSLIISTVFVHWFLSLAGPRTISSRP